MENKDEGRCKTGNMFIVIPCTCEVVVVEGSVVSIISTVWRRESCTINM